MNNQIKLLFYVVFVVSVLLFLQNNFKLPDLPKIPEISQISEIPFVNNIKIKWEKDEEDIIEEKEGEELGIQKIAEKIFKKEGVKNTVQIHTQTGSQINVEVEVAKTDAEKTKGLSNRKYLGDYSGMIFVFDSEIGNSFWMKDTLIPLDIIFIDKDGFIVDIKEKNQPCEESTCPKIFSSSIYKYALEVNGGFCEENDIVEGKSVLIDLAE